MATRSALIIGGSYWAGVLGNLLQRCGITPRYDSQIAVDAGPLVRLRRVARLLGLARQGVHAVHHVWAPASVRLLRLFHWEGCHQILHWVGSDVLGVQRMDPTARRRYTQAIRHMVSLHLADSPGLAEEMQALGLPSPRVVRLLPLTLRSDPQPLPKRFAALSYWSSDSMRFYRGDWVLRLAAEFPHIPFYIVGYCTPVPGAPCNVEFIGWSNDMSYWYERSSVLLRLPEHDSVSVMALEMLARARHVICSQPLPHCLQVTTYAELRSTFAAVLERAAPNERAPEFVDREFKPADSVVALSAAYDELAATLRAG